MKYTKLAAALLGSCSALVLAQQAHAQAPAPDDEVVVTGSRVIQNGNNMPTPVTIVTTEQMQATVPQTISDALRQLPVFSGSPGQGTNPGNSSRNNNANRLNLRNVGTLRTLVLFDGRRVPPTDPTGETIVDILPSMLLQRVDVVTGGASAVYGSDAVTGVVNYITDKNFNGLKVLAQKGISNVGDAATDKFGIAAGKEFGGGRAHVEGSYEYYNDDGIFNDQKRNWDAKVWTVQGNGGTIPYRLVKDTRLSSTSLLGYVVGLGTTNTRTVGTGASQVRINNPLRDMVFGSNGVLRPFQHGTAICEGANCVSGIESGGDGSYYREASSRSSLRSHQVFGRFDYDLTENTKLYVEATGMKSNTLTNHQSNELPRGFVISATNPYLAPAYQTAMTGAGFTTFTYTKMFQQMQPLQPETHMDGYLVQSGLTGDIGKYKWDVSYVHSDYSQNVRNNFNLDNQKLAAAADAVVNPANGQIVCNVTITNPTLYPGCVPLNLFGPTSETRASLDYISRVTQFDTSIQQENVGASIAGSPFDTWAGPVNVAFSGEWRRTVFNLVSDAQPVAADCTGLRFNCANTTLKYISNVVANSVGSPEQNVTEGAFEADVPLLKDVPLVESFNLNGALRYTYYDTSGYATTWKLGIDWHINDELSFRSTRSRDIRAPNLNNLFAPTSINPAGVTDRLTGIVGQAPFITNANPNLSPEIGNTTTAGIVYRPKWLPSFSLAVDWYKIGITDAIANVQGQNNNIQDLCYASGGSSPFCALIIRPGSQTDKSASNFVTAFLSQPQNIATLDTNGVDVEANYSMNLLGGKLNLRGLLAYQPEQIEVTIAGVTPPLNNAGIELSPAYRWTVFAGYEIGKYRFNVTQRWYSESDWAPDRSLLYTTDKFPGNAYTNLTVARNVDFGKESEVFATVQNVFNRQPNAWGQTAGSSGVPGLFGGFVPGVDDQMGRYFTVGLRMRY